MLRKATQSSTRQTMYLIKHRLPMRYSYIKMIRHYSVKPPVYKKTGNILVNALNYVKDVEDYQRELSTLSPERKLVKDLLDRLVNQPELLFLLRMFHAELAKIGITPSTTQAVSGLKVWKYRASYILRLARIHNIFWNQCQYLNISERDHKLGFSPTHIGLLDPRNFEESVYEQIQSGSYKGTNFKEVAILGNSIFN